MNVDLVQSLVNALRDHQTKARIIILEGAGDRSFCAGEDLKQTLAPKTGSAEELRATLLQIQDLTRLTSSSPAIVIAAVQGYAVGGGAEIALGADFVIGGPKATFKFPEASIGHAVTGGVSLRLVQMVGLLRAKELFLRGRFVSAEEALKIGMLTELVDDPKARALELAKELEACPAVALSSSKSSLERAAFPNMELTLHDEVNVASYCFAQHEAANAFSNFAARKAPPEHSSTSAVNLNETTGKSDPPANSKTPEELVRQMRAIPDLNTALQRARDLYGPKTFIRFGQHDTSFQDLDKSVARLAGGLRQQGVAAGDRVLVMMRNSLEMIHTWFATNRLGATWVPVNVELKSVTLQHVVESAAAKIAIVDMEFHSVLASTKQFSADKVFVKGPELDAKDLVSLYEGEAVMSAARVNASDVAAFLYTSGTTGKSKPCILSHQYFILQALSLVESFELNSDDVLFVPFPLFHVDATALTTVPALLLGAVAAFSVRFSASKFWDEVREAKATVFDFMGATLALLYKQPPSPRDQHHKIRLAWGVPIPAWSGEYESRFNHKLYTLYGSVEAALAITQPIDRPLVLGSCGVVRPGYHVRIASDSDEALQVNTPGSLLLRANQPNALFQGYFNAPTQTIEAFRNLWLHTGDIARMDEQGNVFFVGRIKDVIRRRGENINAVEVEEELLQHPGVRIAAAYPVPSSIGEGEGTEEDVKVAVVLNEGSSVDEKGLWEWSAKNMTRFQVPSVVEIVPRLERTPTGKIVKHGLKVEGGIRFDIRNST